MNVEVSAVRGVVAPFLVVTMFVAGCGGGGTSSTPADEPSQSTTIGTNASPSPETASASTTPEVPTTRGESPPPTEVPPLTTAVDQTIDELAVLRPSGLGEVDFGTPADEAVLELTALLGSPDRVAVLEPISAGGDGCVEGAGWLDCLRDLRILNEGRLAIWGSHGLEVALVDTRMNSWPPEQASLQFGDWHGTVPSGQVHLVTDEGLRPGMTVGELRRAVPGVQFGYNEGSLDSFFLRREHGGYWGRLDWNPDTDAIERRDVSAMQAALNEHGANLVVDGEWGPRSETAWLQFLTDYGFEPFTLQPWLMPEIGEALGLPPDYITVATLEPRPPTETVEAWLPILRADGLDRFDVGAPANELVPELVALLGTPSEDTSYTPDGTGPFDHLPLGYWAAYELRVVVWERPDLRIILSDRPYIGDRRGETVPGTLHLISWATTSSRLRLDTGVGVGSTLGELRLAYPNTRVGEYDFQCSIDYGPDRFRTGIEVGELPRGWLDVRGELDWDWVSVVQSAMNERGASLVVDGAYGAKTRAAVRSFQEANRLFANGLIDPETADALELEVPSDARIVRLAAGIPGSC